MRILILNGDYERFLNRLYRANPDLAGKSYEEQRAVRDDTLFGLADFYPRSFEAHGHVAAEIHVNNPWAQAAWARAHGMDIGAAAPLADSGVGGGLLLWLKYRLSPYREALWPLAAKLGLTRRLDDTLSQVLLAQIEEFRPDVILNLDMKMIGTELLRQAKTKSRKLALQIGVDPAKGADLGIYDLGISVIPWVVEYFRAQGLRAERCDLGFEPSILDRLPPPPPKDIDVSFVGSISPAHRGRIEFLEAVAAKFPLSLWVPSLDGIPPSSPLHACVKGEVYGRDMYNVLRRSRITLNSHIDVGRASATNMRVYEASGIGTFLLTDAIPDLARLFEVGTEAMTYESSADCIAKIGQYLADPESRERIAAAGQARTLRDHTYYQRCGQISGYLSQL
jgi:spore maturation protein CgeB